MTCIGVLDQQSSEVEHCDHLVFELRERKKLEKERGGKEGGGGT